MITSKTCLILGAGASMPYGFPSGWDLVTGLCQSTLHEERSHKILMSNGFTQETLFEFRKALTESGCESVDMFLADRPEFMEVGKVAIAMALFPHEATPLLFGDLMAQKSFHSWYQYLWTLLTENCTFNDPSWNHLSIITFNYDRSIEHYLHTAMMNRYGKTPDECAKALQQIPIIHVYGSLGLLPWQTESPQSIKYGGANDLLKIAAENIKIMHEGEKDSDEFKRARRLIETSDRVFFLGFGYHPTNIERLGRDILHNTKLVMGTTYRLSVSRLLNFKQFVMPEIKVFENRFVNKPIYEFLHENVVFS
jgi:hypothetical protein